MKLIIFSMFLCLCLAVAEVPSDLINYSLCHPTIDLRNVTPSSAKAIAQTNENLTKAVVHDLKDLGLHFSGVREVEDTLKDAGVSKTQTSFTGMNDSIPQSIGSSKSGIKLNGSTNFTDNDTIINDTMTMINGTMTWF